MAQKLKVYISGKMRGMDEEESRRLFSEAQKQLEQQGFDAINPWNLEDEKMKVCQEWADFIIYDLYILKKCDMIFMLQNWHDSWGAQVEYAFANGHGIKVEYQKFQGTLEEQLKAARQKCEIIMIKAAQTFSNETELEPRSFVGEMGFNGTIRMVRLSFDIS